MAHPNRGEVWVVDLGLAAKVRPCLVISVPYEDQDRSLVTVIAHHAVSLAEIFISYQKAVCGIILFHAQLLCDLVRKSCQMHFIWSFTGLSLVNSDAYQAKILDRTFREDLFYRLNVVTIRTPALNEIREDIPLLVSHFTRLACCELGISPKRFSTRALEECMNHPWPGNVRELQNFVRRAVMFCPDNVIRPDDLLGMDKSPRVSIDGQGPESELSAEAPPYAEEKERVVRRFTLQYVSDLLEKTNGNVTRAAELSGMRRSALQKIMRRLDIKGRP
jgi:hypothetical protein